MARANSGQMKADGKKLSLSGPSTYFLFIFTLLILLPLLILLLPFSLLSIIYSTVRNKLFSQTQIEKISSLSSKKDIIAKSAPRAYDLVRYFSFESEIRTTHYLLSYRCFLVLQDLLDNLLQHILQRDMEQVNLNGQLLVEERMLLRRFDQRSPNMIRLSVNFQLY
jgi:hypothetical protein